MLADEVKLPGLRIGYVQPCAAMRSCVSGFHMYEQQVPPGAVVHDVFYPGAVNFRFQLDGPPIGLRISDQMFAPVPTASLFGPTSAAGYVTSRGGRLVGVGITPLGWVRMTARPAAAFADRVTPLAGLVGQDAVERLMVALRQAPDDLAIAEVLGAFISERLGPLSPVAARIQRLQDLLADAPPISIADLADQLELHGRALARLCQRAFGFGPKRLIRRARFLKTLTALRASRQGSWSESIDPGYYDHSHFIRDAHDFLGMSPSAFLRLPKPINDASALLRAKVGAAAQELHRPAEQQQQRI